MNKFNEIDIKKFLEVKTSEELKAHYPLINWVENVEEAIEFLAIDVGLSPEQYANYYKMLIEKENVNE